MPSQIHPEKHHQHSSRNRRGPTPNHSHSQHHDNNNNTPLSNLSSLSKNNNMFNEDDGNEEMTNFDALANQDLYGGGSGGSSVEWSSQFCSSIKFLLIIMISILILISVLILSIVWLSAFSVEVSDMSARVRSFEFSSILTFTEKTMNDVLLITESVKSQLYDFDFTNDKTIENHTYRLFKVVRHRIGDILHSIIIGDPRLSMWGMVNYGGIPLKMNITEGMNQIYWVCDDYQENDLCNMNSNQSIQFPPYTSSFIADSAATNPGGSIFSLSWTDSSLPNYVFLASVSSLILPNKVNHYKYSYYFGIVLSVESISKFLVNTTSNLGGDAY